MFHASLTGNRSPLLTAALQSASFSPLVRLHGEFAMSSRESGRKRAPDGSAISQGVVNVTELALKWPRENPKGFLLLAPFVWIGLYQALIPVSGFFVSVLPVDRASYLSGALQFFFYDMPKVLLLLTGIVFVMGMINSHFTPERTRALLAGRTGSVANVMAAILGIVTPFCSCSAVPLFIGFVQAGVPLGVTFSFLIAAPIVNEVALTLLFALFGWKIALLYLGLGLSVAIAAGWVIGRLKMEAHLEDWVRDIPRVRGATSESSLTLSERIDAGFAAMREIVGKVWPYIVAGIGVGAAIHGYVPENFMASLMGKDAWWAVPLAVVIGVPMYSNAAGIIPIVQALLAKGAALGSALAFMMSVIALSLPEMIILRKVLKARLIATFVGVVAAGILLVGYVFNAVL
jgi:uncharacterized membrane protein YraQ (UPF0718 family)